MVRFEEGYRSQLHEEDAYACPEAVQAYWDRPDRAFVRNPSCDQERSEISRCPQAHPSGASRTKPVHEPV
ncbi:hypothetical protein CFB39_20320 [Burkholderia sp. AU6039]|nr:hypothetical protein CFB39_20320 [Burkholderia sp. AU6039]